MSGGGNDLNMAASSVSLSRKRRRPDRHQTSSSQFHNDKASKQTSLIKKQNFTEAHSSIQSTLSPVKFHQTYEDNNHEVLWESHPNMKCSTNLLIRGRTLSSPAIRQEVSSLKNAILRNNRASSMPLPIGSSSVSSKVTSNSGLLDSWLIKDNTKSQTSEKKFNDENIPPYSLSKKKSDLVPKYVSINNYPSKPPFDDDVLSTSPPSKKHLGMITNAFLDEAMHHQRKLSFSEVFGPDIVTTNDSETNLKSESLDRLSCNRTLEADRTQCIDPNKTANQDMYGDVEKRKEHKLESVQNHAASISCVNGLQALPLQESSIAFDDEFDNLDFEWLDKIEAEEKAKKAMLEGRGTASNDIGEMPSILPYSRFTVIEVSNQPNQEEILLTVIEQVSDTTQESYPGSANAQNRSQDWDTLMWRTVIIRGDWRETQIRPRDPIHIIHTRFEEVPSQKNPGEPVIVDNFNGNMLILLPDYLISPTRIVDAVNCGRLGVLKFLTPNQGGTPHPSAVLGTLKHQLFERALEYTAEEKSVPSIFSMKSMVDTIVRRSIEALYGAGISCDEARRILVRACPAISGWLDKYMGVNRGGYLPGTGLEAQKTFLQIDDLVSTEDCIWSPALGLKGFIDSTVRGLLGDHQSQKQLLIPLELKTGRNTSYTQSEHRAQVMLYALMLQCTYGLSSSSSRGLLLYLSDEGIEGEVVNPHTAEFRHLILARNRHAAALQVAELSQDLPPLLRSRHQCSRCYTNSECMVVHRAIECGDANTSGTPDLFEAKTGHLSTNHMEYFRKWKHLIRLEALTGGDHVRRRMWLLDGPSRELKFGLCFSNMIWQGEQIFVDEDSRVLHTFLRQDAHLNSQSSSLVDIGLAIGDYVVVSTEGRVGTTLPQGTKSRTPLHVHLFKGKIVAISENQVRVTSESSMRVPCGSNSGDMEDFYAVDSTRKKIGGLSIESMKRTLFRIDRDDASIGIYSMRLNLFRLFIGPSPEAEIDWNRSGQLGILHQSIQSRDSNCGDTKRRDLIVDLVSPRFGTFVGLFESKSDLLRNKDLVIEYETVLNDDQQAAVQKVLSCKDYALLLGMPGTGKTATLIFIIRLLVARGASVLVTSYTHSAVDNLLLRLVSSDVPCVRIGNSAQVHPEVRPCCISERGFETTAEYSRFVDSACVVGCTCLGVNSSPMFRKRRFDYCVVDEAGQITQPAILGSLRCADMFVLVGDHNQLPPLVASKEAKNGGMDISLFMRLSEAHPSAMQSLTYQYRMNKDLTYLCNTLVYKHRLRCANEDVAAQALELPYLNLLCPKSWVCKVLHPGRRVSFLNTDSIGGGKSLETNTIKGSRGGGTLRNLTEARVIEDLATAFRTAGGNLCELGIISPYRSQIRHLNDMLKQKLGQSDAEKVELSTVDKFQGRDKEVIFVSFVRSNDLGNVGDLLQDWRRINVMLSRAKQALVLIGSPKTLSKCDILSTLFNVSREKRWIVDLPSDYS